MSSLEIDRLQRRVTELEKDLAEVHRTILHSGTHDTRTFRHIVTASDAPPVSDQLSQRPLNDVEQHDMVSIPCASPADTGRARSLNTPEARDTRDTEDTTQQASFACPACSNYYTSTSTMHRHIRRTNDEAHSELAARIANRECPECGQILNRLCDYSRHLQQKHGKPRSEITAKYLSHKPCVPDEIGLAQTMGYEPWLFDKGEADIVSDRCRQFKLASK